MGMELQDSGEMEEKIANIVRDVRPDIEIGAEEYRESFSNLGIDSLDYATILLEVEEQLGVTIPDSKAEEVNSIAKMARFVSAC